MHCRYVTGTPRISVIISSYNNARFISKKLAEIKYDRYTLCEVGTAVKPDDGEKFLTDYHTQWKELVG